MEKYLGPKIANHHSKDQWRPLMKWPESAYVQWGGNGIVLREEGKSYGTAFFEVFPKDGSAGFIRGEGESIEKAEKQAFSIWQKNLACKESGGHLWTRNRSRNPQKPGLYLNGGCFCLKCNSFQTAMKPVVELGEYKVPLNLSELAMIADGYLRSCPNQKGEHDNYSRKVWLKARLAGIDIPPDPGPKKTERLFETDSYEKECRRAVKQFLIQSPQYFRNEKEETGVSRLFQRLATYGLDSLLEEEEEDKPQQPSI